MEQIKPDEFRRLFPNASASTVKRNQAGSVASRAVVESNSCVQLVAKDEGEVADEIRRLVRYTLFRVRPVDQENWCTKHFTDALVTARILFDDAPRWCKIEVQQVKVRFPSEERTEIEITPIETEERS